MALALPSRPTISIVGTGEPAVKDEPNVVNAVVDENGQVDIYTSITYKSVPAKVVFRFAKALAASVRRPHEYVYSHERMYYLLHDVCKDSVAELNKLLTQSFDVVYLFLFLDFHYVIERSFLVVQDCMHDTSLYEVIGDERSMVHFVEMCSSNHQRLRFESGIKFANNIALQLFGESFCHDHIAYYTCQPTLDVACDSPDETVHMQLRNEAKKHLEYDLVRNVSEWSFILMMYQAALAPFDIDMVRQATAEAVKQHIAEPARWDVWMNRDILNAIHQSWGANCASKDSLNAMLKKFASSRYHAILFSNLVGVTFHLKQFVNEMYKRTPIVNLLLRTKRQVLELLHS